MKLDLERPAIYLITEGEAVQSNFEEKRRQILDIIRIGVECGVPIVQLREKRLSAKQVFELACSAVAIAKGSKTKLLINDRADVALAARADGVHLTSTSLPVDVVRERVPKDFLIGVSAHTLPEIADAERKGADLAVFGPVFETPGKGKPTGIVGLSEACRAAKSLSVFGLGGIDGSNYEQVLAAGAAGFAAIRWLNDADELRAIAGALDNERTI